MSAMSPLLFKQIVQRVPGMVGVYNIRSGKYLFVNDAVRKILGYAPADFLNGGLAFATSLVHPDDLPAITTKNMAILAKANNPRTGKRWDRSIVEFEYRMRHKNGRWVWLHTDAGIFSRHGDGRVEMVMNVSLDITKRKITEEQVSRTSREIETVLKQQKDYFEAILRNIADGITVQNAQGELIFANDTAAQLVGFQSAKKFLTTPPEAILNQFEIMDEQGNALSPMDLPGRMALSGMQAPSQIVRFRTKGNTEERWSLVKATPVFDEQKRVLYAVNVFHDITAFKHSEEALAKNQERLELAQKVGNIGAFEWDLQTNDVISSPELEEVYGLRNHSSIRTYTQWQQAIHPDDLGKTIQAIELAIREHTHWDAEYRVVWPDKSIHWIYAKGQVFYSDVGTPLRMVGVNMDITKRKKLERQKDEFIGIASHELKTPVTSIKAYAQVLQHRFDKKGDYDAAQLLGKMNQQLSNLTDLIGDLLDVTKIESGKLEFSIERIDANQLIDDIIDQMQLTTVSHTIRRKGTVKKKITGDRERIGQVLSNLLSNAMKYSPPGTDILVSVKTDKQRIEICVQDYGIGIDTAFIDRVFDRFFRINEPSVGNYPGIGLGLYISKEIVMRMGGTIWVKSSKGKGSLFCFTLPYP